MNKEKAIEVINTICDQNAKLNLCIKGGTASWSSKFRAIRMTPEDWKNIGYVSALAAAFDIKEVK